MIQAPMCGKGSNLEVSSVLSEYSPWKWASRSVFYSRGLFIIDDKGNLRQITINDLPVGRSVDETLRLVQAFQFTDKHGEGLLSFMI